MKHAGPSRESSSARAFLAVSRNCSGASCSRVYNYTAPPVAVSASRAHRMRRKWGTIMKGVVFLANRKLELQDFPDPSPGPGEVVVAIKASEMCGSDLHVYRATG